MTLEEYRIKHSMLIEQYQRIEFNLEGLFAAIADETFCEALREIEKDSSGGIVREIKKIEKQKNISVVSVDEYQELDQLRERRNFWSHECYTETYDKNTGAPKNAKLLKTDLRKAESVLEWLQQIKEKHMDQNRDRIMRSLFAESNPDCH